jgi:hypothetical protein
MPPQPRPDEDAGISVCLRADLRFSAHKAAAKADSRYTTLCLSIQGGLACATGNLVTSAANTTHYTNSGFLEGRKPSGPRASSRRGKAS